MDDSTFAAADAKQGAVIRFVTGAEETAHERLLKKHLPAWVISGAFHVVILVSAILIGMRNGGDTKASDEIVQAIVDKPASEEEAKDLTNPDVGLDSSLAAAVEVNRVEDNNVDAKVVEAEPTGVQSVETAAIDTAAPAGVGNNETLGIAPGLEGSFQGGTSGVNGTGVSGMKGRSGATKIANLKAGGGNSATEAAVARALIWLDKQQNKANGSWKYEGSHASDNIAATGMALLPFLAAGQTHKVAAGNKYKETVEKGLTFVVSQQLPAGNFRGSGGMYSHAIAAIAICEAYGMTGDKSKLLLPAKKAIEYIIKAQGSDGSWGYSAGANGDTSIVGWQIQALQSARMCKDIGVPAQTLDKAKKFLDKVAEGSKKSAYGYTDNKNTSPTLSSVGLLCRYYVDGWGPVHPGMADGVDRLRKQWMPTETRFDMYYYYYATQIMHFHEGDVWHKDWNPKMRDMLLKLQTSGKNNDKLDGSWDPDKSMIGSSCGRLGTTCLPTLTLEVYYRHLPLYKRDTAGLKELERVK